MTRLASITIILTLLGCLAHAGGPQGQIAFIRSTEQEDQCVHVLDLESGVSTPVGPGKRDGAPVWSPDGRWLAFPTQHSGGMAIAIALMDNPGVVVVEHRYKWNRRPCWSPDSSKLAYCSDNGDGLDPLNPHLMVYDRVRKLETEWAGGKTGLLQPAWLPGLGFISSLSQIEQQRYGTERLAPILKEISEYGGIIAVGITEQPGEFTTDLFIATPAGVVPLFPPEMNSGRYLEWNVTPHPHDRTIAFESNDGGDREIFVPAAEGMVDLSNHRAADWNPRWSPDGDWLAFESFRDGRRGIYRVRADTSRIAPLAVTEQAANWDPQWSPDGDWLAFVSDRTGDIEIYAVKVDEHEAEQHKLTNNAGPDLAPAWRPGGEER